MANNDFFLSKEGLAQYHELMKQKISDANDDVFDKVKDYMTEREVQADWNQTEDVALDFIKNKTHWAKSDAAEIVPVNSYEVTKNHQSILTQPVKLEAGKTYSVYSGGAFLECRAADIGDRCVAIGDLTQWGVDAGAGINFNLVVYPDDVAQQKGYTAVLTWLNVQENDYGSSRAIGVFYNGETVHKLDNKYLDIDWVPTDICEELISTCPRAADYGIPFLTTGMIYDGQRFAIYWDGARYECTTARVPEYADFIYVGNLSFLNNLDSVSTTYKNTGEPFLFEVDDQYTYTYFGDLKFHDVKIYDLKENKLPERMLPTHWCERDYANAFYTYIGTLTEKVSTQPSGYGYMNAAIDLDPIRYRVVFDGVTYEQEVVFVPSTPVNEYQTGWFYLGNMHLYNSSFEDTGEPFCVRGYSEHTESSMIIATLSAPHAFEIYELYDNYHPLEDGYIPETIVRKTDLVQADYGQADPEAIDHIKNRTHYDDYKIEDVGYYTASGCGCVYSAVNNYILGTGYRPFRDDSVIEFYANGELQCHFDVNLNTDLEDLTLDAVIYDASSPVIEFVDQGERCVCQAGKENPEDKNHEIYFYLNFLDAEATGFKIVHKSRAALKQLDEKFIPETIARKTDIPEQVQADYHQSDPTAKNYIKNREFYEEWVVLSSNGSSTLKKIGYKEGNKAYLHDIYIVEVLINDVVCYTTDNVMTGMSTRPLNIVTADGTTIESYTCPMDSKTRMRTLAFQVSKGTAETTVNVIYKYPTGNIKQLDSKFIGDDIARVADMVKTVDGIAPDEDGNIQLQKPTSGDIIEVLAEAGMVEPITDENGAIFIEDGVVYTLI